MIEQYGSFSRSHYNGVDEDERSDVATWALEQPPPMTPMTNIHNNAGNDFLRPSGQTVTDSHHELIRHEELGAGEMPENSSSVFINDWSTWGFEFFAGQQIDDTFQSV